MKNLSLMICMLLSSITTCFAQQNTEENAVKATINSLFDGMRKSDSTLLKNAFGKQAILQTIAKNRDGKELVKTENLNNFIKSISAPHPEVYDERITFTKVLIDANLASVWTDYKFYIGDKFSHCGVNSFQLFKDEDGWKIIYLIDTRRMDNCN
jgi:hypothetical protein